MYSIAASMCNENNIKTTMGYMELAYSLGLTVGPLLASFLFYLKGYSFSFYVCGVIYLICIPFIVNLEICEGDYEEPKFFHILLTPVKKF